jgi:predicted O-methyltransferase YrrM
VETRGRAGAALTVRQYVRAVRAGVSVAVLNRVRDAADRDLEGFDDAWAKVVLIPGWLPEASAAVMWGVIGDLKPARVVEIGTYLARSTTLIALAVQRCGSGGRVITVDPHTGGRRVQSQIGRVQPTTEFLARAHLEGHGLLPGRVDMRVAPSQDEAERWDEPIDLLYVDGWHTYEAARDDALAWAPFLTDQGVVAFDDVGLIEDVERGAREAAAQLGLHWYGILLGQGWAGRSPVPPPSLARALRYARFGAA